jgi:hypothetical protein
VKRTAGPQLKPFEIRAGIGIPGFRGMRTVGDPSYLTPIKFRYLQNVRLGSGDIRNRPGLSSFDTLSAPASWITEVEGSVQSATIYYGPVQNMGSINLNGTPGELNHPYAQIDFSKLSAGGDVWSEELADFLRNFGLFPNRDPNDDDSALYALAPCGAACQIEHSAADSPEWADITNYIWGDIANFIEGMGFYQSGACMDPMVRWVDTEGNVRWLAAGAYRGDRFSGVGDYEPPYYSGPGGTGYVQAVGDPTKGGQPIVEVTFETESPLDAEAIAGYTEDDPYPTPYPQVYPLGLTEVFRLPAPGYKYGCQTDLASPPDVPTASFDPTMYTENRWVRSMVTVGRRADDLITGEEKTQETLYIGTMGGRVLAIDSWISGSGGTPDPTYKWGINDPTDGEVWSWDGITLVQELADVGGYVCMATTPDGGVLAAGRTGAAFLAEPGVAWQVVTYNPLPHVPVNPVYWFHVHHYGYFWTSRALFQGEIYLIGFDLGQSIRVNSTQNNQWKTIWADRLVIAKFNPGTLQIDIVRRGTSFDQFLNGTPGGDIDDRDPSRLLAGYFSPYRRKQGTETMAPVLATDGPRLYYLTAWGAPIPSGKEVYVGSFDGTLWNDEAFSWASPSTEGPVDLLAAGGAVWATTRGLRWYKIENGAVETFQVSGITQSNWLDRSRPFVGP